MIAVLMEKLLEVPGSSVEGPFGAGSAIALPEFAKVALFFQECRMWGGQSLMGW
jgi:hypothetical protein